MVADAKQMTLSGVPEAPNGMIAMMERLALNPDLPVEKLEKLLDMQLRIRAIEAEQAFADAMARVQAALPTVVRESKNDQTNSLYAKHEKIAKAIKPIYTADGFSITFSEGDSPKEKHIRVVGILRHRSGHKETHFVDVALDDVGIKGNANKTLTHAEASSSSYGRRRLTCMMFDVATGDDKDGNGAAPKAAEPKITEKQAADIVALVDELGKKLPDLCKRLHLSKIEDLPAKEYAATIALVQRFRK